MKATFYKHIDKYHPIDWMHKCVEIERNNDYYWLDQNKQPVRLEFLQIISDVSIRRSRKKNILGNIPSNQELTDFITLYINTQNKTQLTLLEKYSLLSFSLLATEQIKYKYPDIHLFARTFIMYEKYHNDIYNMTGLSLLEIFQIYLASFTLYTDTKIYVFSKGNITIPEVNALQSKKIELFLNYFSKTIREYRTELKILGLDKHDLYSFRLLELFPLVRFQDDKYIIPSFKNFIQAITVSMYVHLLNHFQITNNQKAYMTDMGAIFENYVRQLTMETFGKLIEAKELVEEGKHAEFVAISKNTSIVVEVKKILFKRDTAFRDDIDDIEQFIERHLLKAYKQIENTFKYIESTNKIGIIVTFGDINMTYGIKSYMEEHYRNRGVEFDKNIILLSIGSYEMLLSHSLEKIVEILNRYLSMDEVHRGDIMQTLRDDEYKINPFLEKIYFEKFPKFKENR